MSLKQYEQLGPKLFSTIANSVVIAPTSRDYLHIKSMEVGNSSGANASVGWGFRMPTAMWKAGQWDDSETASYIEDTTDAQDAGASDFAISTLTNNDGYVIQCVDTFNVVNLVIATAQNNAGTPEYTYWNGAWTTLPTLAVPTVTSIATVALVFHAPTDWTALVSADVPVATDGLTAGMYAIRVRYTTAPSATAGLLTTLNIIKLLDFVEIVGDGASATKDWNDIRIPYQASVVPYCSTADNGNWVLCEYRQGG